VQIILLAVRVRITWLVVGIIMVLVRQCANDALFENVIAC
jgi:hypothetical protein